MPAQETSHRFQTALYWPFAGVDDYGQPVVSSSPQELSVRWEQTRQEATDPQGNTITVDAVAVVDRKVTVGSEMWLGSLDDWLGTGSGSAGSDDEVMRVASYDEVPDLRGRATWRQAGLQRKSDSPSR